MNWLWNSMESSVSNNVMFLDTAKEIHDPLSEMNSSNQNISVFINFATKSMHITKWKSLAVYYATLKGIWKELNAYQPLTTDIQTRKQQCEEFRIAKSLRIIIIIILMNN